MAVISIKIALKWFIKENRFLSEVLFSYTFSSKSVQLTVQTVSIVEPLCIRICFLRFKHLKTLYLSNEKLIYLLHFYFKSPSSLPPSFLNMMSPI